MRKFLVISSLVVAVLVGAVVALPFLVDVNQFKPKIAELIEAKTQRKVNLAGNIELNIFPSLALDVRDIHLLQNDGKTDLVHVGGVLLRVELWPLLQGNVNVDSLVLSDVTASLVVDKQGRANWDVPAQPASKKVPQAQMLDEAEAAPSKETKTSNEASSSAGGAFVLKEVVIERAKIDFNHMPLGRHITLDHVLLKASLDATHSDIDVSGIVTQLAKKHQAFSLVGAFDIPSSQSVKTKDTKFSLGDIKGSINLNADFGRKVKLLEGGLYLNDADVTPYTDWWFGETLSSQEQSSNASKTAAAKNVASQKNETVAPVKHSWSTDVIDLSTLRDYEGHFGIYFDGLTYGDLRFGKADIYTHYQFGVLSSKIKQLGLFDGDVQGSIKLAAPPTASQTAEIQLNLENLKLESLPAAIKEKAYQPSGKLSLVVNLNTQGKSQKAFVNNLVGDAKLKVDQAKFASLGDALQASLSDPLLSAAIAPYRQSFGNIELLDASWKVNNGVLSNEDFRMQSSPVSFIGKSEINLPDYLLYARFTPVRTGDNKQVNFAGVTFPDIVIKGSIDAPKVKMDAGDTVRGLIEKGLSDGGIKSIKKELIENRREIVDELKKGLEKDGLKNLLKGF